jgi:drug/metabolite transporter (DMT)-like permease
MSASPPVIFAVLSLTFAGVNDVVFKRYSAKDRSRGMYVLGIGVVWSFLQAVSFYFRGVSFSLDIPTVYFGIGAGILLTLSNILLIESLTHIDTSLGSTIYRLNTIGVIILASLFLDESVGVYKAAGIAAGIAGVLLLSRKPSVLHDNGIYRLYVGAAVAASLLRAAYGVLTRSAVLHHAGLDMMLLMVSSCWIVGGCCYAILRERRFSLTKKKALYSALSGILVFLIVNSLMLAVMSGEAGTVIPIANMSFVVAMVLSAALGMEALTFRKVCAVLIACLSIFLLSWA